MYTLSIGAIFKNEQHAIKEWIEHYLLHGVQHFYLIDDQSTDNSIALLKEYCTKGIVTLYKATWKRYLGRQRDMYNHYILPHVTNKETQWLYIVDLDEFLWSPRSILLTDVLAPLKHLAQIQFYQHVFGSNGHIKQPESIVKGFTKRWDELIQTLKYMVNSDFEFTSLNVHHATHKSEDDRLNRFIRLNQSYFVLNHYMIQSREFWEKTKCTRGDGDEYRVRKMEEFDGFDRNEVEDLRLLHQNYPEISLSTP